jgi:hypothetical protein
MQMRVRQRWPFPTTEEAICIALRSPYLHPVTKQWVFEVVLQSTSTDRVETQLCPYGMAYKYRVGRLYSEDRTLPGMSSQQQVIVLSNCTANIARIGEVLPRTLSKHRAEELCVRLTTERGDNVVVVPTLELVRILFGRTRTLAFGILDPAFLQSSHSFEDLGHRFHVQFTDRVPCNRKLLTRLARFFARLHLDASFYTAWGSVHHEVKYSQRSLSIGFIPNLAPTWEVTGTYFSDSAFVVDEIIKLNWASALECEEITYSHPLLQSNRSITASLEHSYRAPGQSELDRSGRGIAAGKTIAEISSGQAVLQDAANIDVRPIVPCGGTGVRRPSEVTDDIRKIGMTDRGGDVDPSLSPGEFIEDKESASAQKSESDDVDVTAAAELHGFIEVLERMKKTYPELGLNHVVRRIPKDAPFTKQKKFRRQYILAVTERAWIIELQPLKLRTSATLVVGDPKRINECLTRLFFDGLTAEGWWSMDHIVALFEEEYVPFKMLKHVKYASDHVDRVAHRLHHTIKKLEDDE